MTKKNIILITIDCLRADHINYMEKLMKRNDKIVFTNMFSNATFTGLSIPSMLTSTYPPIENANTTIISYLKEEGYNTAGFVPNSLLLDNRYRKFKINKNFDYYKNYLEEDISDKTLRSINKLITGIQDAVILFKKFIPKFLLKMLSKAAGFLPFSIKLPYPHAERVLNDVTDWINNTKDPYFIWIHLMDVHKPYNPPEKYLSIDRKKTSMVNKRHRFNRGWLPHEDVNTLHNLYIDCIKYVDDKLDDFLNENIDENTIVFITADHGEQFLEHGRLGHINWNMYDEQIHIPLIILNMGSYNIDELVSLVDIAPTISNIIGIEVHTFIGKNLFDRRNRNAIFFAGYDKKWNVLYGIRTKDYKLLRGVNGWELYNLKKDPKEKINQYYNQKQLSAKLKMDLLKILETKNFINKEKNKLNEISKKLMKIKNY